MYESHCDFSIISLFLFIYNNNKKTTLDHYTYQAIIKLDHEILKVI